MRPGRSSLWGFVGAGTPGVKNNKGVADQFGERGILSFGMVFRLRSYGKILREGVVPSTFLRSKCDTPEKVTWQ